ncbi:MAG: hypothetical protein WBQ18_11935 [Solirubrobacteraceae bacterium]
MRRLVLIVTALGVLVAASTAFAAAFNNYSGTVKLTSKAHGTPAKPVPVGYTEDLKASNATPGNRTGVLTDIKTTIYGLKADGKDFPTCSLKKIGAAQTDTGCPKAAMVATGYITATVGAQNDFTQAGLPCNPLLHVWNSGQGKLTFFFVDAAPAHECLNGALHTGQVGPYPGTYKTVGKNLVVDVPVPHYVSFPAPGEAGSLNTEHLVWAKHTAKVHGKTVAAIASVGCQGKKRPYSVAFTAVNPNGGASSTNSVKGTAPCS